MQRTHAREHDHSRSGHPLLRRDDPLSQRLGEHLANAKLPQRARVTLFRSDGALKFRSVVEIIE
jgi:hypothetical protein